MNGLDRFNRIIDQRWKYYGSTPTDLDRYQYGYDRNSSRVWKQNCVGTALDEFYAYDNLNRLTSMQRGTLNSAKTAVGGALVVGNLGRWVVSGNSGTHTVKLVDAATGTDLSGGSVSLNTTGAPAGQFLYAPLANPLPLSAGHGYYLMSQETGGGDQWYDYNTAVTPTSDLTINNSEWYDSSYHAVGPADSSYGPPNFTYGPGQPAITGQSPGWLRNDFTGWVGFKFTTDSGTPVREMNWTLDPTGNWSAYVTKTNGTTDLDQTRTANTVNEITAIGGTPNWADLTYDAAGNTTSFPKATDPTTAFGAVYDAWNRMVSVSSDGSTVAIYQYDGRGRRIVKVTTSPSETRHFYFTNDWQDIEERVGTSTSMDQQYIWGIRYVDELVCRDRTVSGTNERLYAMQDANFNLTTICNESGTIVERYVFDPYGNRSIRDASWSTLIDSTYMWSLGHQGLPHDEAVGLVQNRMRWLHVLTGMFTGRDPIGYANGPSLAAYELNNPVAQWDPAGLACPPGTHVDAVVKAVCTGVNVRQGGFGSSHADSKWSCLVTCKCPSPNTWLDPQYQSSTRPGMCTPEKILLGWWCLGCVPDKGDPEQPEPVPAPRPLPFPLPQTDLYRCTRGISIDEQNRIREANERDLEAAEKALEEELARLQSGAHEIGRTLSRYRDDLNRLLPTLPPLPGSGSGRRPVWW